MYNHIMSKIGKEKVAKDIVKMRMVVGGALSPQALGMKGLKLPDVQKKYNELIKSFETGMPILVKIISSKGLIFSITVSPSSTIQLLRFLQKKSSLAVDGGVQESIVKKAAQIKIESGSTNTLNLDSVISSIKGTLKSANIQVLGGM